MEIDLHGMEKVLAKDYIKKSIEFTSDKELVIIHGYRQGDALYNLVRKEFGHKRIIKKIVTMNNGQTTYLLKDK